MRRERSCKPFQNEGDPLNSVRGRLKKCHEVRDKSEFESLISRSGNGMGNDVENVPISFIYSTSESLGENTISPNKQLQHPEWLDRERRESITVADIVLGLFRDGLV
jgi:hypothetical protein